MGRNLTNLPISASFQYLMQVSGSEVNDGLGNDIDSLNLDITGNADTATTASYVAGANVDGTVATATSASYATTASLAQELEGGVSLQTVLDTGNTAIGDINLTGDINATNVTASFQGDLTGNADTATSASYATTASLALALEGGVSLQSVLDTGNTATEDIILTGKLRTGASNNTLTATNGAVVGGNNHNVSGVDSVNAGGASNTIAGDKAFVGGGSNHSVSSGAGRMGIVGGQSNSITAGEASAIVGGFNNTLSSTTAAIVGGRAHTNSHLNSVIVGGNGLSTTADNQVVMPNVTATSITASAASFTSASIGYLQTITGSAKIIGDAFIILNNDTPTERYAGLIVQDSGSTANTASLLFDGQTNDWFYQYTDDGGATDEFGAVMFGPGYNTQGAHVYPSNNTILKGTGDHHIVDSNITDDGSLITLDSKTKIVGADLEDDVFVVQGEDSGGGAIILAEFDTDSGAGMANTFRFIDSSTNGALLRLQASRGTGKLDFNGTAGEIQADGDITLDAVGGNITLDANAGVGEVNISGSVNIVLGTDAQDVNIINPDEKLALIVRGGIMAGSDETLSTDPGFNNHLFGERITAAGSTQTCGALAGREVDFGGNGIEYAAFVATQNSSFDGASKSAIVGGASNTIDTEDSLPSNNAIVASANSRLGAGETNAIVGGDNNTIIEGNSKAIIGGRNNTLGYDSGVAEYSGSVIVGGFNNLSKYNNTVILGGNSITASAHDTTYTENLDVNGTLSIPGFPDVSASLAGSGGGEFQPATGASSSVSIYQPAGSVTSANSFMFSSGSTITSTDGWNGIFAGRNNSISGGQGVGQVIVGGFDNSITGNYAGGMIGTALSTLNAYNGFIGGGRTNTISSGDYTIIVGGDTNTASGNSNGVVGGGSNNASGVRSVIVGGFSNTLNNTSQGVLLGGQSSRIDGGNDEGLFILGTKSGRVQINGGKAAGLVGGWNNKLYNFDGTTNDITTGLSREVVGGIIFGNSNFIGQGTLASPGNGRNGCPIIIGGMYNQIGATTTNGGTFTKMSTIINSSGSSVDSGSFQGIIGGYENYVSGSNNAYIIASNNSYIDGGSDAFIGGGDNNSITSIEGAIVGGNQNTVSGERGIALGGLQNDISATDAFIIGGWNGTASGLRGGVIAGQDNTSSHARSVVVGGSSLSTSKTDEVVVPSLSTNGVVKQNVESISITSNTGSLDASLGNLFTITLQNGVDTHLELSNQSAGQTFQLKITNNATAAGTISFDSQFEFEGGTAFTATAATSAVDILTFTTFDGTSVQCVGAKNFS